MSIDDAIKLMQAKISGASSAIVVKVVKMSDEEARISVYAPAGDMQKIKDATFRPAIDLLIKKGWMCRSSSTTSMPPRLRRNPSAR